MLWLIFKSEKEKKPQEKYGVLFFMFSGKFFSGWKFRLIKINFEKETSVKWYMQGAEKLRPPEVESIKHETNGIMQKKS